MAILRPNDQTTEMQISILMDINFSNQQFNGLKLENQLERRPIYCLQLDNFNIYLFR